MKRTVFSISEPLKNSDQFGVAIKLVSIYIQSNLLFVAGLSAELDYLPVHFVK